MKLMVVEDEPKLARSLCAARELAGHAVDQAFDGEAALEYTSVCAYGRKLDPRGARLSVQDTGTGIAEPEARRNFERFYRAEPSRDRRGGGTGLGLAIASRIVSLHSGKVSVESRPGVGSAFVIELPLADPGLSREIAPRARLGDRVSS